MQTSAHIKNKLYDDDLKNIHMRGVHIARKHITPYLHDLEKRHDFSKLEIASALILLGASVIKGSIHGRLESLSVFAVLSKLSFSLLNQRPLKKRSVH